MHHRLSGSILSIGIATAMVACGTSAPSPSPSPEASPGPAGATSFDEYATAFCSAWGTMFRVVGNLETADLTDAVQQLQAAADAGDDATAAGLQGKINNELETARQQIAYAAGWPPAARTMAEMDRIFVAVETKMLAHVDVAKGVPDAPDAQAAFEAAGGLDAWRAFLEAFAEMAPHRPASVAPCPGIPIGP